MLRAPYAIVSVDGLSLFTGNLQPKLDRDPRPAAAGSRQPRRVADLLARAGRRGGRGPPRPPAASQSPSPEAGASMQRSAGGPSQVSGVVGSLFDLIVGPKSVLNSLGRAQLTNATPRLRRCGPAGARDASTGSTPPSTGPRTAGAGSPPPSRAAGRLAAQRRRPRPTMTAAIAAASWPTALPSRTFSLLAGLSALPATTDLEFSGRVDAAFAAGRVTELKARLDSNGRHRPDRRQGHLAPAGRAVRASRSSWDEAAKALDLRRLELKGGDNHVRLHGRLAHPDRRGRAGGCPLPGRDAVLSGAARGGPPVRVSEIAAELSGPDGVGIRVPQAAGARPVGRPQRRSWARRRTRTASTST